MRSSTLVPCATSSGSTRQNTRSTVRIRMACVFYLNSGILSLGAPVHSGQKLGLFAPTGTHFYEGLQENFALQQPLQILASLGADSLQQRPSGTDQDGLLPATLHINDRADAQQLGRVLPALDHHRD